MNPNAWRQRRQELVPLLEKCARTGALEEGCRIHKQIAELFSAQLREDTFVGNLLIKLYARCGRPTEALAAFQALRTPDAHSWSQLIAAKARGGEASGSIAYIRRMRLEGVKPNKFVFSSSLHACASLGGAAGLSEGRCVQACMEESGMGGDILAAALIDMLGKCGDVGAAEQVFLTRGRTGLCSTTAMVAAFARNGECSKAVEVFEAFSGRPDPVMLITAASACSAAGDEQAARKVHAMAEEQGLLQQNTQLANAVLAFYGKHGMVEEAKQVFERISSRKKTVVSWNSIISAYANACRWEDAMQLFRSMDLAKEPITFLSVLSSCCSAEEGREIHRQAAELKLDVEDVFVATALTGMYARCGCVAEMKAVFRAMKVPRNAVAWSVLILGYAKNGQHRDAITAYGQMQEQGMPPTAMAMTAALEACAATGNLEKGAAIHDRAEQLGMDEQDALLACALVSMYEKCGALERAEAVFNKISSSSSSNRKHILITAYNRNGRPKQALDLFLTIDDEHCSAATFVAALAACAELGALAIGRKIHGAALAGGGYATLDAAVGNALVHMYGRCASLEEAAETFGRLRERNAVTWTSLVSCHARLGRHAESLRIFAEMLQAGVMPDAVAATAALQALSHARRVWDARIFFRSMEDDFGIRPGAEHYAGMVDVLARAGWAGKAGELVAGGMPFHATAAAWSALLSACRRHWRLAAPPPETTPAADRAEIAAVGSDVESVADITAELLPASPAPYMLLYRILAQRSDLHDEKKRALDMLRARLAAGGITSEKDRRERQKEEARREWREERNARLAMEEGAPLTVEDASLTVEDAPLTVKDAPLTVDGAFSTLEDVPLPVKAPPLAVEEDPLTVEEAPLTVKEAPLTVEEVSLTQEEAEAEEAPLSMEESPLTMEEAPSIVKQAPRKARTEWRKGNPNDSAVLPRCYVEWGGSVVEFVSGNREHPFARETSLELLLLNRGMVKGGLRDAAAKEAGHPAKRAVAFGLATSLPGTTVRVVKTLRLCSECHAAAAYASKLRRRRIVVRDYSRFHEFNDGVCSCGDEWDDKRGSLGGSYRHLQQRLREERAAEASDARVGCSGSDHAKENVDLGDQMDSDWELDCSA